MFTRYGFSNHTVGDHSMVDATYRGRNCICATLRKDDDAQGKWGDTPERKLYRSQLSANFYTVFNRRETINFSTCIPEAWEVVESGVFRWDGTQPEQAVLFGMHSNGPEPAELSLSLIGDHLVWWYHNKVVWQAKYTVDQWDDWRIVVHWHNMSGSIEIYRNNAKIFSKSPSATLLRQDQANYLKAGVYLWHWPAGVIERKYYFSV
jgi:hypothetical protein